MQWLFENKEWLFSGAGAFIISAIIGLFVKNKQSAGQIQKSGTHSNNYQAGGNITIRNRDDK